jgi:broad specificity phosphatase PhoE
MDIELTDLGRTQARTTGRALSAVKLSAVYSSPLKRALHTAQAVAEPQSLTVEPLPGLLDINYGAFQGLSMEEAEEKYPNLYSQWRTSPHQVTFPNGEGLKEVRERAVSALNQIIAEHDDATVALVSHQVVCKVLVCHALGIDNSHFWRIEQDLCSINHFEVRDGHLIAVVINETCHLKGLSTT